MSSTRGIRLGFLGITVSPRNGGVRTGRGIGVIVSAPCPGKDAGRSPGTNSTVVPVSTHFQSGWTGKQNSNTSTPLTARRMHRHHRTCRDTPPMSSVNHWQFCPAAAGSPILKGVRSTSCVASVRNDGSVISSGRISRYSSSVSSESASGTVHSCGGGGGG